MSTKVYQFLGKVVTESQLKQILKDYVPTTENAEIVSWIESTDDGIKVFMKDGREFPIPISQAKEFETVSFESDTKLLHFYDSDGVDVFDPVYIDIGTGTGIGTVMRLTNQNGSNALVGSYGSAITLMFTFTSTEDDLPTGNGICTLTVNGVSKMTINIPQGLSAIDVSPYLNIGNNTVKVTCTDVYGNARSLTYSITVIQLSIESTFDATVPYSGDITFKYTPYGSVEKTVHFMIDGTEESTVVTSLSGKQLTKTFPAMSHGVHRLEVYSTAEVTDATLTSKPLVYDIICTEDGDNSAMIASVYSIEGITQGSQVSIPYIVYDPTKLACDITLTIYTMDSGTRIEYSSQTITVDRSQHVWNTRKYPVGTVYFEIKYGSINKTHTITVTESTIQIEPETTDLEIQLTSEGRSNDELNPSQWAYGDFATTFQNMNWESVGWVTDQNGDTCLRLSGDARAEINFKPFDEDLRTYGKTIELEFAIRDVNNREAIPISCMSGNIGFEVKTDTAYLKSEQSEVFCNYKDGERVKVTFVIESKSEYRLFSVYLNGVRSDAVQYPTTDNFQQSTPVNISLGSSDCGIDIYTIRSYTTALTSEGVKNNFIADLTDIVEKTKRYEDNDIYDDYGNVSFTKAKEKNSVMVIIGDLPTYKGDKKKVTIQYYDVKDSNLNHTEDDVSIDVQGTSSQWYVRKNWKLKYSEERYIDFDQLPAKVICIKVDYAEATGTHNTHNAVFVEKLYSEQTPAQKVDPKCRTTIYGKPILLFHQADESSDPVFYGKANYNYDKGAEYVFGFTEDFDVECWEFCNNTSDACNFLGEIPSIWVDDFEARYPEDYTNISRFKEMHDWVVSTRQDTATGEALDEPYTDADGVVHTNDTAAYRLAKFKMEFEDHFNMHYCLIYYVYTFFALMVDQRAKNMFLTYWGATGKWEPWFYDNDTSFGINNEGQLVLDYYHEDTDLLEGANVYNGQNSVLWCNFREAFPDKIKETYQDLRSNSVLNYDELVYHFITNGSDKWSESIYNEDADFKYISMLQSDNDASNLGQVRGTGEEHFRYFVSNRLPYCDGKWYAGEYPDDYVSLRIYTPTTWTGIEPNADITVIPYSHMYTGVRYKANGTLYQQRAEANEEVTFEAPNETFNDTETAVYGASHLSSLGDLSPLYCGSINVAKATKLTELIIGSNAEGYTNPNLNELSIGTNNLLKIINIRNCTKLTDPLGLAGCPNIEEIYAGGSGITGVELAESGYLKIVELPATIANLTFKNQTYIETLTIEGYESIKTVQIENCPSINSLDILGKSPNVERARLTGVNWSYDDASAVLALLERNIAGIDENGTNTDTMWIDGKCYIKTLTGNELAEIKAAYPYLEITYTTLTSQLVYMSEDGITELHRETIINGGNGTDPIVNGTLETPTKESTAQYHFTYSGWSLTSGDDADENALLNVEEDRYVYVAFAKELRSYKANFYNGTALLQSTDEPYGSVPTYTGGTPTKNDVDNPDDFEFTGWSPEPTGITGDINYYAQYYDTRVITDDWTTIAQASLDGTAIDKYSVGAYKPVEITYEDGTTETIDMEIVAHNHDELPDGVNKWEKVSTIPYRFQQGSMISYNNEIHYFAGPYGTELDHYKWNGTEWTKVSTLLPVATPKAIIYNDELHILRNSKHYKWDVTNSSWTEVSTIPVETFHSVVVYNNEIYVLGGSKNAKKHYKWDGSEWTEVSTLPMNHYGQSCAVVYNNEIHLLGCPVSPNRKQHHKWNETDGWSMVGNVPAGTSLGYVYNDEIHLIAGQQHYKYDGTEWINASTFPYSVTDNTPGYAIVHNNEVYVCNNNAVMLKWSTPSWVACQNVPFRYNASTCVVYKNELHIMGGYNASTGHAKFDGESWINDISTLPCDGTACKPLIYNGEIHILKNAEHYKWDGTEWTSVSTLPFKSVSNGYMCAEVYMNEIHIINTYSKEHYKWDGSEWTDVGGLSVTSNIGPALLIHDNKLVLLSGTLHYEYDGSAWTQVSTIPIFAVYHRCFVYNDEIHVIGKTDNPSHYKWNGNEWVYISYETIGSDVEYIVFREHIYRFNTFSFCKLENPRATLTFLAKNLLSEPRNISSLNQGTWNDSGASLRTWLHGDFISSLPNDLQSNIKDVRKPYNNGSNVMYSTDKIFIPSTTEVGRESQLIYGEPYPIFTDIESIMRNTVDGLPHPYWLRSKPSTNWNAFRVVTTNVSSPIGISDANDGKNYVLPGFCI